MRQAAKIALAIVGAVAVAVLVATTAFFLQPPGSSCPTYSCPVGSPCAPPSVVFLRESNGSGPSGAGPGANLTVISAWTCLTADDLQFAPVNGSGTVDHAPFTVSLVGPSAVTLATFNSTLSSWDAHGGESASACPFGGWVTGGTVAVLAGYALVFHLSVPAAQMWVGYWLTGVDGGQFETPF